MTDTAAHRPDVDPFSADLATLRAVPVGGTLLAGRWTWCTLTR